MGIIEHGTTTDYSKYGIAKDHPALVKGKAGSPYAIKDYYDVNPDLAVDVKNRMTEFESLVQRTHEAGLKVIIDIVANHISDNIIRMLSLKELRTSVKMTTRQRLSILKQFLLPSANIF